MWSKLRANLLPIGSNSLIDPVRQLLGILPWIPKEPRYPIITSHLISSFVKSIQIYGLNLNKGKLEKYGILIAWWLQVSQSLYERSTHVISKYGCGFLTFEKWSDMTHD